MPDAPFPPITDDATQARILRDAGWLAADEAITGSAKAGEGNMNLVLRVHTDRGRSVVLKQARPWVEKYPDIAAPLERAMVEAAFYRVVAGHLAVARTMPTLLHADAVCNALVFTDLGEGSDCADAYRDGALDDAALAAVGAWLGALHAVEVDAAAHPALANRAMRALNHAHIFAIPLDPANGLDLAAIDPGLPGAAAALRGDSAFCARVAALGERYLADGPTLLHGDCYPGSWLRTAGEPGIAVIDPEFGFLGDAAFDVGVTLAHLHLAGMPERAPVFLDAYTASGAPAVDQALAEAFAGVEVMRRLIGVAQLPLADGADRAGLLATARDLVLGAPS